MRNERKKKSVYLKLGKIHFLEQHLRPLRIQPSWYETYTKLLQTVYPKRKKKKKKKTNSNREVEEGNEGGTSCSGGNRGGDGEPRRKRGGGERETTATEPWKREGGSSKGGHGTLARHLLERLGRKTKPYKYPYLMVKGLSTLLA